MRRFCPISPALVDAQSCFPAVGTLLFILSLMLADGSSAPAIAQVTGAAPRGGTPLPHELSPWAMFMAADIVVKGVMVGLALASVAGWAIWMAKLVEIRLARRRVERAIGTLATCTSLRAGADRAVDSRDALTLMIRSAQAEVERLGGDRAFHAGIKERVASEVHRIEMAAGRQVSMGTGVLATIGSTAPFVGLFGTVWGIMNSFIGISKSQTTNLAVVAPGIAEALLATAIGLVAAIPAVIFYNQIARAISGYRASVADGGALVQRILSRDLDVRAHGPHLCAAAE